MTDMLSYAAITPARNEAENLRRLAPCMMAQTLRPRRWIIVDNGSTDETPEIARALAAEHDWVCLLEVPGDVVATRGAPVVRAFHAGVAELTGSVDVVVKLDADVAVDPEYFARQQEAFVQDASLGIAGGVCMEPQPDGTWAAAKVVYDHVRGAIRAYRWDCLQQVTPLEERVGWDGVDEMKAQVNGWRTRTIPGLSFLHYRVYGSRESRWHMWTREGDMSHFMGYRFSYLLARTVYHLRRDPSAAGMVWGYAVAAGLRRPRVASEEAIAHLRDLQRVRALPVRMREKLARAPDLSVS